MNRTVLLFRRTLLCAVFACPLAARSLTAALMLQCAGSLLAALLCPAVPAIWHQPSRGASQCVRALFCCCAALALSCLLHGALWNAVSNELLPLFRSLCVLSGILIQAALLLRVQKAGKRHLAACLPLVMIMLAYRQ